jgi:hypothetical protein
MSFTILLTIVWEVFCHDSVNAGKRGEILPETEGSAGEEPGDCSKLPSLKELKGQVNCRSGSQATF